MNRRYQRRREREERQPDEENNNRKSIHIENGENIKKDQPQPKRVAFFDAFTFIVVAAVIFFNNLTSRSIIFNVVLSAALLFKVLIGICFYKQNNARSLRSYFIWRYLYNIFIVYPLIIILRYFTATYVLNYFLAGGITLLFEIIITICYIKHLCKKTPIENIEDIPGFVIRSKKGDQIIMHIKSNKAGEYLIKSLGKKNAEKIINNKQKELDEINMKKNHQAKVKSGKQMTKIQQLEFRKEQQSKAKIGFNLIRSEEEIEAEIEYEEILQAKIENSQKYMSFQDRMSRNVVNDSVLEEYAPKQKEKIQQVQDAREDMEKEREKLRKAFQSKQNVVQVDQQETTVKQLNEEDVDLENGEISKSKITGINDSRLNDISDQRTAIKDGPNQLEQQDEENVINSNQIRIGFKENIQAKNKQQISNQQSSSKHLISNSDVTLNEEDIEPQTDRAAIDQIINQVYNNSHNNKCFTLILNNDLFDRLPKTNNSNLSKPVSSSHQQISAKTNNNQNSKDTEIRDNSLKQKDNEINQKQSTLKEKQQQNINTNTNDEQSNFQNNRNQIQEDKNNTKNRQQKEEKQKFKSYEEKFEIQRLKIQNEEKKQAKSTQNQQSNQQQNQQQQQQQQQQQRLPPSSQQQAQGFSGKHAYARNKIQQELQRKAELKRKMEEERRMQEEEGSDSDDSDDSYDSDETPRTRKQRKLAKQQKLMRQKTKKIHGVNDDDDSSSLSEDEDGNKKIKTKNKQKDQNKGAGKQVRFDENRNMVKQISNANDNNHHSERQEFSFNQSNPNYNLRNGTVNNDPKKQMLQDDEYDDYGSEEDDY